MGPTRAGRGSTRAAGSEDPSPRRGGPGAECHERGVEADSTKVNWAWLDDLHRSPFGSDALGSVMTQKELLLVDLRRNVDEA